jgi:hypothetical protein
MAGEVVVVLPIQPSRRGTPGDLFCGRGLLGSGSNGLGRGFLLEGLAKLGLARRDFSD